MFLLRTDGTVIPPRNSNREYSFLAIHYGFLEKDVPAYVLCVYGFLLHLVCVEMLHYQATPDWQVNRFFGCLVQEVIRTVQ